MSTQDPSTSGPDSGDAQFVLPEADRFGEPFEQDGFKRILAVARRRAAGSDPGPGLFWLSGYMSDLGGTKASALDRFAAETGRACVRFDYTGHGESSGDIRDGTIGRWLAECRHIFDRYTDGPQVVIGSSMGGYLATLMARDMVAEGKAGRIAALVLIAPAIDMTERLLWARLDAETRKTVEQEGEWLRPSEYDDTVQVFTRRLFEEGRNHLLSDGPLLDFPFQTIILQGRLDDAVPPDVSLDLAGMINGDVTLSLIHDGDHRLSTPEDIAMLIGTVSQLG